MNKASLLELLNFILESISLIKDRFDSINDSDAETIFMICDEKLIDLEKNILILKSKI